MRTECGVSLHNATEADLEKRNERWSEMPGKCYQRKAADLLEEMQCAVLSNQHSRDGNYLHDTFAGHAVGLLIHSLDVPETLLLVFLIRP